MILVSKPESTIIDNHVAYRGHIIIDDKFIPYEFIEYHDKGYFIVRFSKNGMELDYQRAIVAREVNELVEQAAIYLFNS